VSLRSGPIAYLSRLTKILGGGRRRAAPTATVPWSPERAGRQFHLAKAAVLDHFDAFAGGARNGAVQLSLSHVKFLLGEKARGELPRAQNEWAMVYGLR
jgi:hypothetical protein